MLISHEQFVRKINYGRIAHCMGKFYAHRGRATRMNFYISHRCHTYWIFVPSCIEKNTNLTRYLMQYSFIFTVFTERIGMWHTVKLVVLCSAR